MNDLSNSIYLYYIEHFDELTPEKQFHFASRLYLWSQDNKTESLLKNLRPYFTAGESPRQAIHELIESAKASPAHGSKNAGELRAPYFQRYPQLKPYVTALFRLSFLQTVYGIDARQLFNEVFSTAEVEAFQSQLLSDRLALAILSTHAINFIYLYEHLFKHNLSGVTPELFLDIGQKEYNFNDPLHLQLLIYLYTHCLIGDSRFYYQNISTMHRPIYEEMMTALETLIDRHFDAINLDNKFEYLVCCRLMGSSSALEPRILAEAESSLSDQGTYLIDRYNANPQLDNVSLDKSEHRNALFIMATRPFSPLG